MILAPGRVWNGFQIIGSSVSPPTCMKSVMLPPVACNFRYIAIA